MKFSKPAALGVMSLCLLTLAACAGRPSAQTERVERESSQLVAEPGFRGDRLGVRIEKVGEIEDSQYQAVYLRLPMDADMVDEVEVVGPAGRPIDLGNEPRLEAHEDERISACACYCRRNPGCNSSFA